VVSSKAVLVLAGSVCLLVPVLHAQQTQPEWVPHYEECRAAALHKDHLMILSLETEWCSWCFVMEREVFSDPEIVRRYGSSYVWVHLDAEATPEGIAAQRKFKAESYPFIAVVDPVDEMFVSFRGYRDVGAFARAIDDAASTLHSLAELRSQVRNGKADVHETLKLAGEYQERGLYAAGAETLETLRHDRSLPNGDQILFSLAICRASAGQNAKALRDLTEFRQQFSQSVLQSDAEALRWEIELRSDQRRLATKELVAWLGRNPNHHLAGHVRGLLAQIREH